MALIDRIAPFMTPQADVAGALRGFANSIQEQNKTEQELQNQRELRQASLAQSERAVQAENTRAQRTIEESKRQYDLTHAEKLQEQQSKVVDEAIAQLTSGDPAQHELAATKLKQNGIEMISGAPEAAPVPPTTPSTPLPTLPALKAIGGPPVMGGLPIPPSAKLAPALENTVSSALNAIGGPATAQLTPAPKPEEPASSRVKFMVNGQEIGSFDPEKINKSRTDALEPMFKALVDSAQPLEKPFYEQQIAAVRAHPEFMNLPAQTLLTYINEAVKFGSQLAGAGQRAETMARAQAGRLADKDQIYKDLVTGLETNPDVRAHFTDGGRLYIARLKTNPRTMNQASDMVVNNNRVYDMMDDMDETIKEYRALGATKYAPKGGFASGIAELLNKASPDSQEYKEYKKAAELESRWAFYMTELQGVKAAIAKTAGSAAEREEAKSELPSITNFNAAQKLAGARRMLETNTRANLSTLGMSPNAPGEVNKPAQASVEPKDNKPKPKAGGKTPLGVPTTEEIINGGGF